MFDAHDVAGRGPSAAAAPACRAHFDVIVIGAGQAGLAAGYHLQRAGMRFLLVDADQAAGQSWRARWDTLRLFTPARFNSLPGMPFPGHKGALPSKDEVANYLAEYAHRFELPIAWRTSIASLRHDGDRFHLATRAGLALTAAAVIVATGANQRAYRPSFAEHLTPHLVQLHSSAYRRPEQLPHGKVLVVGAGNSGVQIALDLVESGRSVVLSGRETGSIPRRVLGRDIYDWLWPTLMRASVESRLGRHLMQGRLFAGDPLIGLPKGVLEHPRLERTGRVIAVDSGLPRFEDGRAIGDCAAIVWCTGFRPDYGWIEMPLLGLDGYPRHRRGLALDNDRLGFVGMRFQSRMNSALLGGVGEDAAFVVNALVRRLMAR